jgi:hypothetical protein
MSADAEAIRPCVRSIDTTRPAAPDPRAKEVSWLRVRDACRSAKASRFW